MSAELIPVREHNGKTAVSLRDLHGFLEVKKDFTNWAKAMFEYGFIDGQDYVEVYAQTGENPSGGRPARNWAISLDMAKELSMIQRTDKGKQARQYFIEVEKRAQAVKPKSIEEMTLEVIGALQSAVEAAKEQVAVLAPKADAFDALLSTAGDYSVNEAAKVLARDHSIQMGEGRLRKKLEEWGWIYRSSGKPRAKQYQVDLGRMTEKAQWHYHPVTAEKVLDTPQVRITAKGIDAIRQRILAPMEVAA